MRTYTRARDRRTLHAHASPPRWELGRTGGAGQPTTNVHAEHTGRAGKGRLRPEPPAACPGRPAGRPSSPAPLSPPAQTPDAFGCSARLVQRMRRVRRVLLCGCAGAGARLVRHHDTWQRGHSVGSVSATQACVARMSLGYIVPWHNYVRHCRVWCKRTSLPMHRGLVVRCCITSAPAIMTLRRQVRSCHVM